MNEILVLSADDVRRSLPMRDCIAAMRDALIALADETVHNPLRVIAVAPFPAAGVLGVMPAIRGGDAARFALKEICVVPANHERGLDSHQGSVLLHNGETGQLECVLNASAITAIRTAAASAVATDLFAAVDVSTLAIVGAGVQAHSHVEALRTVRDFTDIRVCARRRDHADTFAAAWAGRAPVVAVDDPEAAVRGAQVIATVTSSETPVIDRAWIDDGAHINAVGSSARTRRELDSATIAAAALFVDRRESALNEAGDYLLALADGAIGDDHIRAELGEVLTGRAAGRASRNEITVFKSLGLAVEDLAAGELAYDNARSNGWGASVAF